MKEHWKPKDILDYLNHRLQSMKSQRNDKRTELQCLSNEIDSLEEMIFTIERNTIDGFTIHDLEEDLLNTNINEAPE